MQKVKNIMNLGVLVNEVISMKIHTTSQIDNETRMEMVLSECSYNSACDWLERKGFTHYDKFDNDGRFTTLVFSTPSKRTFVYDEKRGYLLGD